MSIKIPDQLNIIIRTSIPGFQEIEYKPSMTIKDIDEKDVKFNPLIQLKQYVVNKIPEEYRIKQFFNKGLFQSLLNYTGSIPAKNLIQAMRYGYIDDNINVTLNSIFPVGSVIHIDKKPYVIADHQWTTGDWKIKGSQTELSQLPKSVIIGNNYSGPPVIPITTSVEPKVPQKVPGKKSIMPTRGGSNSNSKIIYKIIENKNNKTISPPKLAYVVVIDMELYKGTTLTPEQISQAKCNSRYNAIRKAFAEFTGKPYVIPPVYPVSVNNTKRNKEPVKGGKRKTRRNIK
jgi:hypothetical protein